MKCFVVFFVFFLKPIKNSIGRKIWKVTQSKKYDLHICTYIFISNVHCYSILHTTRKKKSSIYESTSLYVKRYINIYILYNISIWYKIINVSSPIPFIENKIQFSIIMYAILYDSIFTFFTNVSYYSIQCIHQCISHTSFDMQLNSC
jgi:hypothetical protein